MIVVVGPGGVLLEGLNAVPPGEDTQVTVHARSGPVELRGRNHAGLIIGPPLEGEAPASLDFPAGSTLIGGLILSSLQGVDRLEGSIQRDDRHFAGFTGPSGQVIGRPENFFVGLSPRLVLQRAVVP
jgi:hypothetical protein